VADTGAELLVYYIILVTYVKKYLNGVESDGLRVHGCRSRSVPTMTLSSPSTLRFPGRLSKDALAGRS